MRIILLYSVLFGVYLNWHPFHVSVMDMEHNAETHSIEVSHRIFLDDLEFGLKKFHKLERLDTYKPADPEELDRLIGEYLKKKVFVVIDGQDMTFNFLGSELEGDARWCYYEIKDVSSVKEIEITNVALMDVFDDQQNIVHFKNNGVMKSYKLDINTKSKTFNFQ